MKLKVLILTVLAFVALVLFGDRISGVLARRQKVQTEMNLLREKLGLADLPVACERHGWICPASVTVSNQVFKLSDVRVFGEDLHVNFDLVDQGGMIVAWGGLAITLSSEHAVRVACRAMVADYTGTVDDLAKRLRMERDATGALFFENSYKFGYLNISDRSILYGVYGNLSIRVVVMTEMTPLCAWDFVKPLIHGGLMDLTDKQRTALCKLEGAEKKWMQQLGYGIGILVLAGLAGLTLVKFGRKKENS